MPKPKINLLPHKEVRGGFDYPPEPEAKILNINQIDEIGYVVYSRFYYKVGNPSWKDDTFGQHIRDQINKGVKEVIDAMIIKGYKITPPNQQLN